MALLDKLAQLATNAGLQQSNDEDFDVVSCVEVDNRQALVKRARAKYFTNGITNHLRKIEDSPLRSAYINTYHCGSSLVQSGSKIKSTSGYCKNRWCMVCNRIRTAVNINRYLPVVQKWEKPFFVTLTIPNVSADCLGTGIEFMHGSFDTIRKRYSRRFQRGVAAVPFCGLRKFETTYNPVRNDFHPHFHFVVSGEDYARALHDDWLNIVPGAECWGQDIRSADERSLRELFKYFTKVVSSRKSGHGVERRIYVAELDLIFRAIRGRRTFQSFGFVVGKESSDVIENKEEFIEQIEKEMFFTWKQEFTDWINDDTGEFLTEYVPSKGLIDILEKI